MRAQGPSDGVDEDDDEEEDLDKGLMVVFHEESKNKSNVLIHHISLH